MTPPNDPLAELRATFYAECDELLDAAQEGLLAMQADTAEAEAIHAVFRAVHSIKGAAGAFALNDVVSFAHALETRLSDIRAGTLPADNGTLALLLRGCDGLGDLVAASRDGTACDPPRIAALCKALEAPGPQVETDPTPDAGFKVTKLALDLDTEPPAIPTRQRYRITFAPTDLLYELGNEPLFLFRALSRLGALAIEADSIALPDIGSFQPGKAYLSWTLHLTTDASEAEIREVFEFVEDLCGLEIALTENSAGASVQCPPPDSPATSDMQPGSDAKSPRPLPQATLRVDLDRIERLGNLVGELVIAQTILSQRLRDAGLPPTSPVSEGIENLASLTRETQSSVIAIRAQPLAPLFRRMTRIVREASAAAGKPARLITEGDGTEIDASLIEGLAEPLTHMLRNAIDHGLEAAAARAAAGKPAEGTVRLTAAHRSGHVVIALSDDGGGIDRPKVLRTAIARRLVAPDKDLSEAEIDSLLFLPGFSTAGEVSALSGRGVGMDVVRGAVERLGGRIDVRSEKGLGTTFSISLPLTLALLDGMIVETAGETLVLPVRALIETRRLSAEDVATMAPGRSLALIRGRALPLVDLGAALGYRAPPDRFAGLHAMVISPEDDKQIALTVDAIGTQQQVVSKRLNTGIGPIQGISAATILGDGQVALILDPHGIAARAAPLPQLSAAG